MALSLKLKLKPAAEVKPPSPPATAAARAIAAAGGEPANPPMFFKTGGVLYQKYLTTLGDMAVPVEEAPPAVTGPYRAAHTAGRPDNEWEVRDGDGLLVQQVIGGDFEAARKRCFWLAGKLNQAYDAGRRDGQRDTKRRV